MFVQLLFKSPVDSTVACTTTVNQVCKPACNLTNCVYKLVAHNRRPELYMWLDDSYLTWRDTTRLSSPALSMKNQLVSPKSGSLLIAHSWKSDIFKPICLFVCLPEAFEHAFLCQLNGLIWYNSVNLLGGVITAQVIYPGKYGLSIFSSGHISRRKRAYFVRARRNIRSSWDIYCRAGTESRWRVTKHDVSPFRSVGRSGKAEAFLRQEMKPRRLLGVTMAGRWLIVSVHFPWPFSRGSLTAHYVR